MRKLLILAAMSTMLLSGCAFEVPFARVRGTTMSVTNPTERHVIAKVTCSCRVFDGEYDRYFVLAPQTQKDVPVYSFAHQKDLVCAVDGFEFKTPGELRVEAERDLARRNP